MDNINLEETDPQEEPTEPPVESGKNMIQNGDFAEGDAHWTNAVTPPGEADVTFADGKAVYQISNVGTEDWNVQLKHAELLTLEQGASYQVQMRIKSTKSRTVKYAFLNPTYDWYGGEDLVLNANEEKEVDFILKCRKATDNEITFVISMGQIKDNETQEPVSTPASTIEIADIRVVKVGEGEDVPKDPVAENMIQNGDFASGKENWADYVDSAAAATTDFTQKKARYEITKAGTADWNVQLKQEGITMEAGASYKLEMKIGASIDRDVKVAFMGEGDAWHGGTDISLTKDKLKSVNRIIKLEDKEITGTIAFQVSLGQLGETELEAHAIEISDISLTKVENGATAGEETETEATITPPENKEESNSEETDTQDKQLASEEESSETETESTTEEESCETETESMTEEESCEAETESTTEEESSETETESMTEEESCEAETESMTEEESSEEETESTTEEESSETKTESTTEEESSEAETESTTVEESCETETEPEAKMEASEE